MGFAMDDISWTDLSPAEQRVIAVLGAGISTALCDAIALQSLRRAGLIKGSRLTPKAEQLRKAVILTLAKPIRAAGVSSARRWSKDWTSPAASWGAASAYTQENSVSGSSAGRTAIGTVVNTASRAQSAAGAAQILVTREVWHRAQPDLAGSEARAYQLKGFEAPIELYGT